MRATPDFDFQLGEAAEMIRASAARFADEQIMPLAERTDRDAELFAREPYYRDLVTGSKETAGPGPA